MNRPPFNKRELRRLADACKLAGNWNAAYANTSVFCRAAARDAAAFARLRLKVEKMIEEKKR